MLKFFNLLKKIIYTSVFLTLLFLPVSSPVFAKDNNFISIVNPVRGSDFWEMKNQNPQDAIRGQAQILKQVNLPATWLIRFDALNNQEILNQIPTTDEKGLFLEITPIWSKEANVIYRISDSWHSAGSAFLTGYEREEREKLVDTAFEKYKSVFNTFPESVGAWWIDSYSLSYMEKKYGINGALIVADQYTTDNYQIWGQYFSTPYYPVKNNALHPAQTIENKLPIVISQWAARDPVNSYGNGVSESTYSVQLNDYIDYHDLDINYFKKLVDIYTKQSLNKFSHLVIGLENSYIWDKYAKEYENQINLISQLKNSGQIRVMTLGDFSSWYKESFPQLSPEQIIVSDDTLGTSKKSVWFMNPFYRAGWFFNQDGSVFRDIHQYVEGAEELCYKSRCDSVNFATTAIRVLDEVSFGHKLIIDHGKISDFKVSKDSEKYQINYKNEVGNQRVIEFLPRDISIDGKVSSIDTIILEATSDQINKKKEQINLQTGLFNWSILSITFKTLKFIIFTLLCLAPGFILVHKLLPKEAPILQKSTLSIIVGFTLITLLSYLLSILKMKPLTYVYMLVNFLIILKIRKQLFTIFPLQLTKFTVSITGLIIAGTIFQIIPAIKNGLNYPYGFGFWGPNTHDGIWHIALINQLIKSVPPQNPVFAGEMLKNYHYFYDLLISTTSYLTKIPPSDLLFRFYPITFSILLGTLTYFLIRTIWGTKNQLGVIFALFLVYFSGSFGWIVEYIKYKHLGGESAFWANQSISFNLNPPFAVSLLIIIAVIQLLPYIKAKLAVVVLTILCGTLIAFKSYAAILLLLTIPLVGIIRKNKEYIIIFLGSSLLSGVLFLSNFNVSKQLIIFSPFWFIHSMIDSPDRVGWTRLTLARVAGVETGNWYKFLTSELVSLLIFVLGNMGTRMFALLSLVKIKSIFLNTNYLFIFVFSILSLCIPILFIQAGNPWNTIQFIYYFLYISSVVSGLIFGSIILRFPKKLALVFPLLFIIITPINSWATANGYLTYQPHAFVSTDENEGLKLLSSQKNGVVLTYPYDKNLKSKLAEPWPLFVYDSTAYVSAFSGKSVYLEDEPQNQILLTEYKKRLVGSKDFFLRPDKDFLIDNKISYIYLPKMLNIRLNEDSLPIANIFENNDVVIYKVKQ